MNTIILDFTDCKSYLQIHMKLKETFGFPDFYGNNLSALWDSLWEYCPPSTRVLIKGVASLPKEEKDYVVTDVFDVFSRLTEEEPDIIFEVIS